MSRFIFGRYRRAGAVFLIGICKKIKYSHDAKTYSGCYSRRGYGSSCGTCGGANENYAASRAVFGTKSITISEFIMPLIQRSTPRND